MTEITDNNLRKGISQDGLVLEEVLGYFSPATLTLKTKYRPNLPKAHSQKFEVSSYNVEGLSNFVHELTHYLQFCGTIFGLEYQLARAYQAVQGLKALKELISQVKYLRIPVVRNIDLDHTGENLLRNVFDFYKLHQYTSNLVIRSIPQDGYGGIHYSLSGEVVLENWATCNQHMFLVIDEIPRQLQRSLRSDLTRQRDQKYWSINADLSACSRDILAPLIYWIAFNPPMVPRGQDWKWLLKRTKALISAAKDMNPITPKEMLLHFAEIEEELCKRIESPIPRLCIADAVKQVESQAGAFRDLPEVRLTLDIMRWVSSKQSIELVNWPMVSSWLGEDIGKTPFLGFPIWSVIYEGADRLERWGHFVHEYPPEFFGAFEEMKLRRILLPRIILGGPKNSPNCPVPSQRSCSVSCTWCSNLFSGKLPIGFQHDLCAVNLWLDNHLETTLDRLRID